MAQELQVKQYIAIVQSTHSKFMVFATDSPMHYLFCQLDKFGCQTGLQIPMLKSDLRKEIRSALNYGWGNVAI